MAPCASNVQQLLKLKERGAITLEQFLELSSAGNGADAEAASSNDAGADEAEDSRSLDPDPAADQDGMEESVESVQQCSEDACDVEELDDENNEQDDEDAGTQEAEEEETSKPVLSESILNFIARNKAPAAGVAAARKPGLAKPAKKEDEAEEAKKRKRESLEDVRNNDGRGASVRKNGSRLNDVKPLTMKRRLEEWPNETLMVKAGQIWCQACARNVASGKQGLKDHCHRKVHVDNLKKLNGSNTNKLGLQSALHDYKNHIISEHGDGAKISGLEQVPEETQIKRAECLEEFLKAGVEVLKLDALRPYLERSAGFSLTGQQHMMTTYLPPLKIKEEKQLRAEFKGEFVGVYHDGTTHHGESFAVVYRACKPGFVFRISCVRVDFLRGSMSAAQISSTLLHICCVHMQVHTHMQPAAAQPRVNLPHAHCCARAVLYRRIPTTCWLG